MPACPVRCGWAPSRRGPDTGATMHASAHEPAWRRLLLAALGTAATCVLYVVTVALVRFAPERSYRPRRPPGMDAAQAPPPEMPSRGDRIIRCAIGCYRHS